MSKASLPPLEGLGDASIEELIAAAAEEEKEQQERQRSESNGENAIDISEDAATDADFYEEFLEYFNATSDEITIEDVDSQPMVIRVERLGIFHLKKYQQKLTAVARKIQDGTLPMDVIRDGAGNVVSQTIIWQKAWPLITDIIVEELLELIMDSTLIKTPSNKFVKISEEQFDKIPISDFPFIVVPWIDRNFANPKSRAPWQRMVAGLLRKFGLGKAT